jgi:hypothetical protein
MIKGFFRPASAFDKMMKEKRRVIQVLKGIRRTHTYTRHFTLATLY